MNAFVSELKIFFLVMGMISTGIMIMKYQSFLLRFNENHRVISKGKSTLFAYTAFLLSVLVK